MQILTDIRNSDLHDIKYTETYVKYDNLNFKIHIFLDSMLL